MSEWIRKHKFLTGIIVVGILLALLGIPLLINVVFKYPAFVEIFAAEWSAGDALGYYGAVLSFLGTVVLGALALYQNHIIKTEADKRAEQIAEQERKENMPKFHFGLKGANGFCGKLGFRITNVSDNVAYDIEVYDMKLKAGVETLWADVRKYSAPSIKPQTTFEFTTDSPARNGGSEYSIIASMRCSDKYGDSHEYVLKMVCTYPNKYERASIVEI